MKQNNKPTTLLEKKMSDATNNYFKKENMPLIDPK